MNIQQSINRGFNLLATSITGLAAFAFLPEAFLENDLPDKVDDTLLFLIGMVGILWYNHSSNRSVRSVMPAALVVIACFVKIGGLMIEFDDPSSAGDDFGGVILFALAAVLVVYQYIKTKKLLAASRAL